MRTRIDAVLRAQAAEFAFRFACEDCAHFDGPRERCSLAYPAAPRRAELTPCAAADATDAADPANAGDIVLCKTFELA